MTGSNDSPQWEQQTADTYDGPRASVVMTVYNDFRFLDEAVDSVLRQDMSDLELIIVDDGSGRHEIFDDLQRRDPRIRLVVNATNLGAAEAANRGIEAARSDIIVRLDADDISEPSRVGRLVAALDADPELGLIGSCVSLIDEHGVPIRVQPTPETDIEIRWTILFHSPFYHSAVAFRRDLFEAAGRYIASERVSHDTYLWFHMLPLCRAGNLAEPLARYRLNPRGLIATHSESNPRGRTHSIRIASWRAIGLNYDLYDDALARDISEFLRGLEIARPEKREPAYRVILVVLRAFLSRSEFANRHRDDADRLKSKIVRHILASPPDGRVQRVSIWWRCWMIDWHTSIAAIHRYLADGKKSAPLRISPESKAPSAAMQALIAGQVLESPEVRLIDGRLLAHAPSSILTAMPRGSRLNGQFGFFDGAWRDGDPKPVSFSISVLSASGTNRVFDRILDPKGNPQDRGPQQFSVDLAIHNSESVELLFRTEPGTSWGWTYWSELQVET